MDPSALAQAFEVLERGRRGSELAALSAGARKASPYDAATEALPTSTRDVELYARLAAAIEAGVPAPLEHRHLAALSYHLGVVAFRDGDLEVARRRLLLSLLHDPLYRMAHVALARVYRALETEALKTPEAKSDGAILAERVGVGSSDAHIEMAQEIVDRTFPEPLAAVGVSFLFDGGAVRDVKIEPRTASANSRAQRPASANPDPGSFRVVLIGDDHEILDERWFAPVERLHAGGSGPDGMLESGRTGRTPFPVSCEMLAPRPGERVAIYDAAGKRIAETRLR